MYGLLTHIFEWRQAVSMCHPTSLIGCFQSSILDIGDGLRARQDWCLKALDSFEECYGSSNTTSAVALLQQLGYILLDVSLSDLHLVAGRSGNAEDEIMAEQPLRAWANGRTSGKTMGHVVKMLRLANVALDQESVSSNTFEIAGKCDYNHLSEIRKSLIWNSEVCLFTGGIICWAYNNLRVDPVPDDFSTHVKEARGALAKMQSWRMYTMFSVILKGYESDLSII